MQFGIGQQQMLHIAVHKAVIPQTGKNVLQITQFIQWLQGTLFRHLQNIQHPAFIALKQGKNNRLLILEVVIQIARRNRQMGGNMIGRYLALTLLIKELQAGVENSFFSTHAVSAVAARIADKTPGVMLSGAGSHTLAANAMRRRLIFAIILLQC